MSGPEFLAIFWQGRVAIEKMIRQSSSRNQRSKGFRAKHILQICLLLAVCFWLVYQVKHSYDKRKHFEENDGEISGGKLPKFDEVIKLGRKDIRPRDEEVSTNHEKIDDENVEDEETPGKGGESVEETQEDLERKRKEEGSADIEALLDGTSRGEEGSGGQTGDDDIDEQDLDKTEKESDGDDDVVEKDQDEENEIDEKDGDNDNENQQENDGSSDDQDHDSGERHEAREEHYKADDASSAVMHVGQNILSENPEHKNVNSDLDAQELGSPFKETDIAAEQSLNSTNVFEAPPGLEAVLDKNETSEVSSGTADSTQLNKEGRLLEWTPEQNTTTMSTDKSSNTTNGTEYSSTMTGNTTIANVEQDVNSNSATNQEDTSTADFVVVSNIKSDTIINGTDENNEDAIQDSKDTTEQDSILSSLNDDETLRDPLTSEEEDKESESVIDMETLPELRTEGTGSDDAAVE